LAGRPGEIVHRAPLPGAERRDASGIDGAIVTKHARLVRHHALVQRRLFDAQLVLDRSILSEDLVGPGKSMVTKS
jgi:hypothetical protein